MSSAEARCTARALLNSCQSSSIEPHPLHELTDQVFACLMCTCICVICICSRLACSSATSSQAGCVGGTIGSLDDKCQ